MWRKIIGLLALCIAGVAPPAISAERTATNGSLGTPAPLATGEPMQSASTQAGPQIGLYGDGSILEPGKPAVYQDKARGYMLVAPPSARIQPRGDSGQIAIQSRTGYAVNIQTGDSNPSQPLQGMLAKLEMQYLGDGKPWSRKISDDSMVLAGLPARVAVYGATSTRTRVVIARGQKTDFVFMFFAPVALFEKLSSEFEWILASFRPGQEEIPKVAAVVEPPPAKPEPAPLRAKGAASSDPAGRPQTAPKEPAQVQGNVFSENGYGYRLEYPIEWMVEKPSAFTNVFSGKPGTPAYEAIVAVQNVQSNAVKNADEAALAIFSGLKSDLSGQAAGVDFIGEKPITYSKHGLTLVGRQFVATYNHQGRKFRKWALVLPRPDGNVAHIWSYTAPMDQFDAFRPVAESILNSFLIDSGA